MPTISINNVSLNYTEAGYGNERTIVFAHPLPWGAAMFGAMTKELAEDFHVIAVNIHGHGRSGIREPLTIGGMTDDFNSLLEQLDLAKVTWLGISIGGMIGMRLALAHPEKLSSLILMATSSHPDAPDIKQQTLLLWEMFRDGERETIADPAMQFFFARKTFKNQPALIELFRRELLNFDHVDGMFAAAIAAFERDDISDQISAIGTPTLVIAGSEDLTATPQEAEFMASRMPNARLKIFEEANHLLAIERTREVVECIREFVE